MPTGEEIRSAEWREEPVQYTFYRGEDALYHVMLNPRATFRWVAAPGSELFLPKRRDSLCRLLVEPCYTHAALTMISNIERPDLDPKVRPRKFTEVFHWKDGEPTLSSVAAVDLVDQHILEGA